MAVTVSLVLLFGALLAFLLKVGSLKAGACFVAVMFGFLLASTGASGPINQFVTSTATQIGHMRP
ncbi:hypothetical protein QMK19_15085 [Streptomyces sp. H10-C2]|uniref:hypothetical protein n=1 Tax=unclassified Streptomyces TaxID=2593676 RepID=UPI0024B9466E|nr:MULTISPECIES: hypothetical protein [unclassified Streptomyces]MDJ0341378.1 hypothetical protein [Streptomyces sp. PH10-H1]MDJ0370973.1 hypothetical protein [Streptomyces sp. H10-C2]